MIVFCENTDKIIYMYDNYDYLSVAFRILKGLIYSLDPSLVNDDFLQPKRPLHQVDRHQLAAARRLMFCNPDKQLIQSCTQCI